MKAGKSTWIALIAANAVAWCMLSFLGSSQAQNPAKGPFLNSVEQRQEMVIELREIKELLKEQNELLKNQAK